MAVMVVILTCAIELCSQSNGEKAGDKIQHLEQSLNTWRDPLHLIDEISSMLAC